MAVLKNVPGKGYGNPYIDSLVWGDKAWDMSEEPILVYLGGQGLQSQQEREYQEAAQVHGELESGYLKDGIYIGTWVSRVYGCNELCAGCLFQRRQHPVRRCH